MASTADYMSPSAQRDMDAMNARIYAMTAADRGKWYRDHPIENYLSQPKPEPDPDSDAAVLRQAAEVLKRRFGVLTAGDLIQALRNAAYTIEES